MNAEVALTLDDAVEEVLGQLTGLDLTYEPEFDRYRAITRQLNRALRANALEQEWGYYADTLSLGGVPVGEWEVQLPGNRRPRIVNDDAVRLVDSEGHIQRWAYILPRDSLHKYQDRSGLWCSMTDRSLQFSRRFMNSEGSLEIQVPVMREPRMFRLPAQGEPVSDTIRNQLVDFYFPDVITARAAYYYAQSDPVMQPRVQTLEGDYRDLMFQLIERDTAHTDSASLNQFRLNVQPGLMGDGMMHRHPHSDFDA
jgi:hypothetical protein